MLLSLPATARANVSDVNSHVGHTPPAPATIATRAVHDALALRGAPYAYGGSSTFPNNTWQASNYWVDVVFAGG